MAVNSGGQVALPGDSGKSLTEVFELYDNLPRPIREFFQQAPYNSQPTQTAAQLIAAQGVAASLDSYRKIMANAVHQSVLETYGPDHPQAK